MPNSPVFRPWLALLLVSLAWIGPASGQTNQIISVDSNGAQGNEHSYISAISADGNFVLFHSLANNLVAGDLGNHRDVFLHDRRFGVTSRVSLNNLGGAGNSDSWYGDLSGDGTKIVFYSYASNFHPADFNNQSDVFLHDRILGTTTCLSVDAAGNPANHGSFEATISNDGNVVAFGSLATNIVANSNFHRQIYVHDLQSGLTKIASRSSQGLLGTDDSSFPSLSDDGRFISFVSDADNLVAGDTNNRKDVFVRDRLTGITERVSVASDGSQANGSSGYATISGDGRLVAFASMATNLGSTDQNHGSDVFLHDRSTGETKCLSLNPNGKVGNSRSSLGEISPDGRYVTFSSYASDLVDSDLNDNEDVFVVDLQLNKIHLISSHRDGRQGNHFSNTPRIAGFAHVLAFSSGADNLAPADNNGFIDGFVHDYRDRLEDSILLSGPDLASPGSTVSFQWSGAPENYPYWIVRSMNLNGTTVGRREHGLNVGTPVWILDTGMNSPAGEGSYTSAPIPGSALGHTIYLETFTRGEDDIFYDSNVHKLTIL